MANFNGMHAPTSTKYVAEQGIMILNPWQTLQSLWSHSSSFLLEEYPRVFLPLNTLMVTFNEKRAPTFRKIVVEPDIIMSNFFQSPQFFWSHSSVFAVEK